MRKALENGLTGKEERFCALLCRGLSQTEAYRQAGYGKRMAPEHQMKAASKLAAKEQIRRRVVALLEAAQVTDLDSIGRCYADLLKDVDSARAEGNWTAVAALTRLRTSILGMLRDTVTVSVENSADDGQLIERLAGGDPAKAAALEAIVGRSGFAH